MTDTNTAGLKALQEYLKDCDAHAIVPDVGGAWHAAFQAGRASLAASAGSEPVAWTTGLDWRADKRFQSEMVVKLTREAQPKYGFTTPLYTHPSPPEGMAGWRDIATAPKDEMYRDGSNAYAEYILAWYPGAIAPIRARWWQSDSDKCNFLADGGYAVFPTVWQPMPAPPLPASEAKEL